MYIEIERFINMYIKFRYMVAKGNKKVTLSVDSGIYDAFQKYCNDNAIMLSKRIELFMKEVIQNKK